MKKHITVMAVSMLALGSCGIYTKYEPATEVPDDLFGEEVAAADPDENIGALDWREIFTDPALQTLIEHGLQNNTDLQSAQWRVEEAEAAMRSAKLAYLPSFAFSPQGTVSSFDFGKATQTYSLPVTAAWEADIFGRLRNAKRQAKAVLEQSRDYRQAVRSQLIAGIANTYYTLLMLDRQLEISTQTRKSWEETVESYRALKEAGLANEAAVGQMEAVYYNVCSSVLDLQEQINQVENAMSLLLARTPHTVRRGRLADQVMPENIAAGVPLHMLANRPDVRSAEHGVEVAFYAVNQARSAFYPSIVLSGSAGWTNAAGNMIVNPGKFLASAIASLTQPIFNRGANVAQLKIAKARQEEAKLAFQQALLNAGAEVNEAVVSYQTARGKAEYYDKQIESLRKALENTSYMMQYGGYNLTYIEVLTARQSLLNAQLAQAANRFIEIQSVISLYRALGGGRE